ncbi:MAG: HAD-IIA family hydrolase [Actinomycetota bacterium]
MALVDSYDVVLLDLDGVLFRGDRPIPGAGAAVERIRALGRRPAFVTNNASRTPSQVVEQLASVGVVARAEEVETSARTAATILAARGVRRVLAIGQDGVLAALADAGIPVVGLAEDPEVVLVGLDRGITYAKLRDAALAVQRGAPLIATNGDRTFPAEDGLWPGAGALLAAVVATTGASPEVLGKPSPAIFRAALDRAGGGRPIVVGDRLDTDIAGAVALGWDSLLVLTGVEARDAIAGGGPRPTFIAADVRALVEEDAVVERTGA